MLHSCLCCYGLPVNGEKTESPWNEWYIWSFNKPVPGCEHAGRPLRFFSMVKMTFSHCHNILCVFLVWDLAMPPGMLTSTSLYLFCGRPSKQPWIWARIVWEGYGLLHSLWCGIHLSDASVVAQDLEKACNEVLSFEISFDKLRGGTMLLDRSP